MIDVSVITPVYDEPMAFLEANIKSVENQKTAYNFEHIIVLDAPPNKEKEYIEYLNSKGKMFFVNEKNLGLAATRNVAIRNSKGEYLMLLDCDDIFAPDRIQSQLEYMKRLNIDHCYGSYGVIDVNGLVHPDVITPPEFDFEIMLAGNNLAYCGSNCFKRKIFDEIGGFDEEMKFGAEDFEYWLRIAKNGYKVQKMDKLLYYLRIHGDNMTARIEHGIGWKKAFDYIKHKHHELDWTWEY